MKIYAPNKHANGIYASVMFVNGVGETDKPHLIEWFKSHGYRLEEETFNYIIEPKNEQIEVENDQIEPDFEAMTPNDLRDWMRANGYGTKIKNTRNKEKLLEILKG